MDTQEPTTSGDGKFAIRKRSIGDSFEIYNSPSGITSIEIGTSHLPDAHNEGMTIIISTVDRNLPDWGNEAGKKLAQSFLEERGVTVLLNCSDFPRGKMPFNENYIPINSLPNQYGYKPQEQTSIKIPGNRAMLEKALDPEGATPDHIDAFDAVLQEKIKSKKAAAMSRLFATEAPERGKRPFPGTDNRYRL